MAYELIEPSRSGDEDEEFASIVHPMKLDAGDWSVCSFADVKYLVKTTLIQLNFCFVLFEICTVTTQ